MDKLDKINREIKNTWKFFFKMSIFFVVIFAFAFYLFDLKEKMYIKEYNSTTWYEVEATYSHSSHHQEQDSDGNYEDSYDWYYNYVAKDGKTYTYIDKNNSIDGTEGSTTTIYVDENDYSHSLEIRSMNKEDNDWAKKIAILIVVVPYAIGFLLAFTLLYIRRGIAKAKAGVV